MIKDIIGRLAEHNSLESAIAGIFGANLEVYRGLAQYLDALVAAGTIREWRAYPYDWRYDPTDVVQNGTPTELADGSVAQVYLADVVREIASSSPSGKVTVVAHSNGGLVAKALALSLGADAARFIDRIVMIGTPQWGTPSAVGAMLHADNFSDVPSLVINSETARALERDMGDPYDLLPAASYFARVADPVATFDEAGYLSGRYASAYGVALSSSSALASYLTDTAGLDASAGEGLRAPIPLRGDLLARAADTHAALDAWKPPEGISVTSIAGWGQDTVKTLAYTTSSRVVCANGGCADAPELAHVAVTTQDGDGTVVSPSAIGEVGEGWYFNAARFRDDGHGDFTHQNLTSAMIIQDFIKGLLTGSTQTLAPYIATLKPETGLNPIIRISSHSPVNLIITDSGGRRSGVLPIPGTDFAGVVQDIPGSAVHVLDDEEYVSVPQEGAYQVTATGYAKGSAILMVEQVGADGAISAETTFSNVPTAASSTATFSLAGASTTPLAIDLDGDGGADLTAPPLSPAAGPLEYLDYMQDVVKAMELNRLVTHQLEIKLANIGHLIKRDGTWESGDDDGPLKAKRGEALDALTARKIDQLAAYVVRQERIAERQGELGRPKNPQLGIPPADAELILAMINTFEALAL